MGFSTLPSTTLSTRPNTFIDHSQKKKRKKLSPSPLLLVYNYYPRKESHRSFFFCPLVHNPLARTSFNRVLAHLCQGQVVEAEAAAAALVVPCPRSIIIASGPISLADVEGTWCCSSGRDSLCLKSVPLSSTAATTSTYTLGCPFTRKRSCPVFYVAYFSSALLEQQQIRTSQFVLDGSLTSLSPLPRETLEQASRYSWISCLNLLQQRQVIHASWVNEYSPVPILSFLMLPDPGSSSSMFSAVSFQMTLLLLLRCWEVSTDGSTLFLDPWRCPGFKAAAVTSVQLL